MPDINMQVFEEAKRNQLVTEVDIQTQVALDDYQVQLSDIANPTQSQDNVIIDRFGEFLPHWNELLDFDTWVKMSMELAGKRILMLRGNSSVSSASNGDDTFIKYHGATSTEYLDSTTSQTTDIIWEWYGIAADNYNSNVDIGIGDVLTYNPTHGLLLKAYPPGNNFYRNSFDPSGNNFESDGGGGAHSTEYRFKIVRSSSDAKYYVDGNLISTFTINLPTAPMGLLMNFYTADTATQYWAFIRKYAATEPTWAADGEQNIAVALKSLGRAG